MTEDLLTRARELAVYIIENRATIRPGGKALRTFQIDRAYRSNKLERLIWAIQ